jgi:hypothetical protein
MGDTSPAFIASAVTIGNGLVNLSLLDGSVHAFPIHYYPRLRGASAEALSAVQLRVGGRALRWDELDEDIWIADAILQRYPAPEPSHAAEDPTPYRA